MAASGKTIGSWVRDDRHGVLIAGMLWVLLVLMIVPEGFDYSALVTANHAPTSGGAVSRLLWLGLLGFAIVVIAWRAGLFYLLTRSLNPFLLGFVALAIVSVVWSIEPVLTLRRDVRLITIVLVCVAFSLAGWHARRFQNVVRPLLTLVLLGSVAFGIAFPVLAIHQETSAELVGAWRGLTNHKNSLGALACITLIFWVEAWLARQARLLIALFGCVLAVACLLLSRSATSLITAIFATLFLVLLMRAPRNFQPYLKYIVAIAVSVLVVYALAILGLIPGLRLLLAPITLVTGFDTTFTGRSEIWAIISEHIRLNPWVGTGYGAYWIGPVTNSPSYEFVVRMGSFYPGSAHNGYLEIANDLGWAGLLCLLGYIVFHLRQSLNALAFNRQQGALYLALFIQQALVNLSESHWFSVLSVNFVIMTLATVALARSLLEFRLRAYFGEPMQGRSPLATTASMPALGMSPQQGERA
ncbi:MAG: O-antigen ligase family protein [Candidatus Obscuribacterales bacterium]|nr:O-antigen ligase family protein [Steroidobacteraceae bacterium]